MKLNICEWLMDEDGVWTSECGAPGFSFAEGPPSENSMNYCPSCGCDLVEINLEDKLENIVRH